MLLSKKCLNLQRDPWTCWARVWLLISAVGVAGAAPVSLCSHLFQPPLHAPSPTSTALSIGTQMFDHGETSLQTKEEETRGGCYLAPRITDLSPLYCQHKHDRQHWDKVEVDFSLHPAQFKGKPHIMQPLLCKCDIGDVRIACPMPPTVNRPAHKNWWGRTGLRTLFLCADNA